MRCSELVMLRLTKVVKVSNHLVMAKKVVGRVGQFSSNTTNTLLENLMSCSMKNVEHDLPTNYQGLGVLRPNFLQRLQYSSQLFMYALFSSISPPSGAGLK